ncbi:MAG: DMT family transporter [Thaumarchaeota archaeon]|nr:DMT family transporter [Nitrososphaerota archaeon]
MVSIVPVFSQQQWLLLLGFSIFSTVLPYTLFTQGVRTVDATSASVVLLSTPIATAVMGALILQETLVILQIAGAVLILLGILIIGVAKS